VSSIEIEQFIAKPPAAVWRALTEPDLLARWWVAGDIRPVVGHRFTLDMGAWGPQPCQVLEVEAEKGASTALTSVDARGRMHG